MSDIQDDTPDNILASLQELASQKSAVLSHKKTVDGDSYQLFKVDEWDLHCLVMKNESGTVLDIKIITQIMKFSKPFQQKINFGRKSHSPTRYLQEIEACISNVNNRGRRITEKFKRGSIKEIQPTVPYTGVVLATSNFDWTPDDHLCCYVDTRFCIYI